MNILKTPSIFALSLAIAVSASAQSPRRRGTGRPAPKPAVTQPPAATSQPNATSSPEPAPKPPVLLAIVNGQNLTTADIDPRARQLADTLDERIAETGNQILEMEINTLLLATEANKRRLTPQQFYDLEVTRKIADPSAAEVAKFIADNRVEIGQADARKQVIEYLRGEREQAISAALVKRLRASTPVVTRAALSGPSMPPSAVLATVGGRPIVAGTINDRLKPIIYNLRLNSYRAQRESLDQTIDDLLLLGEANRRGVGPEEIVRTEISDKLRLPTEDEIGKFFTENKASFKADLNTARNQIAAYLQEQNQFRLESEMSTRLRKGANIRILLAEPAAVAQAVSVDDDPVRGPANAAVTVVEFTDFQCPSCAAMHPVLEEVLKSYGTKVRFVVRDFPLAMHADARKAAEAANAAHAQGKFFEYATLLFKHQKELDVPSLKRYATELGLDRVRFDAALDSGKFAAEVRHDIAQGELYGVGATPTIFINGVMLTELTSGALRAAIDRALANAGPKVSQTQ